MAMIPNDGHPLTPREQRDFADIAERYMQDTPADKKGLTAVIDPAVREARRVQRLADKLANNKGDHDEPTQVDRLKAGAVLITAVTALGLVNGLLSPTGEAEGTSVLIPSE